MTHFIGAVVVPKGVEIKLSTSKRQFLSETITEVNPGEDLDEYLVRALDPFSENKEYERWVPKAEVIARGRKAIQEYAEGRLYQEYLADPEAYAATVQNNPSHLKYLQEEFPLKLKWTDDEVYADQIQYEDSENVRESDGAVRDTYNPKSQWDWWVIGGRWEKMYADTQGVPVSKFIEELRGRKDALSDPIMVERAKVAEEAYTAQDAGRWSSASEEDKKARDDAWEALVAEPAFLPWAFPYNLVVPRMVPKATDEEVEFNSDGSPVLVEDFEWIEKGSMGWFGMHNDKFEPVDWIDLMLSELSLRDPDDRLVFIDFHI